MLNITEVCIHYFIYKDYLAISELYCSPAIKPPTLDDLSALNDTLRLGCTVDDLKTYQGNTTVMLWQATAHLNT